MILFHHEGYKYLVCDSIIKINHRKQVSIIEEIDTTLLIALHLQKAGFKIFMNKQNGWNLPVFHVQGGNGSKPDLLAYNPRYENYVFNLDWRYPPPPAPACFTIELKTGDHLRDFAEGREQLVTYWGRFISRQVRYYTEKGTIQRIDCFLLATRYSPVGYLYKREPESRPLDWEYITDEFGFLEYPMTMAILSAIFFARSNGLVSAGFRSVQQGRALMNVPQLGVLKAGITKDFRVTPQLLIFLPRRVVMVEV